MWRSACLVLCTVCVALTAAQTANETSYTPPPTYPMPDMSGPAAMLMALDMQQQQSHFYGTVLLDFQSTMGWMQVAQSSLSMMAAADSSKAAQAKSKSRLALEEDEDEDEEEEEELMPMPFPAAGMGMGMPGVDVKMLERQAEAGLLLVVKLMYMQATNKLQSTQRANYIMKVQVSMAQSAGANLGPVLGILYYREVTRLMGSAITIQRQDALNTYTILEIVETDADRKSAPLFRSMDAAFESAALSWHSEATLDLYLWMLDYYLSMYGVPPMPAHSSFLETESTAEPSKPFFSPQATMSYVPYLNLYAIYLNYMAAQSMYSYAHIKNHPEVAADKTIIRQGKYMAFQMLYQWSYVKFFITLLSIYSIFGMGFGGAGQAHPNMAVNMLQTAAPINTASQ